MDRRTFLKALSLAAAGLVLDEATGLLVPRRKLWQVPREIVPVVIASDQLPPTGGQKTFANSIPVVIASDQVVIPNPAGYYLARWEPRGGAGGWVVAPI